MVHGVTEESDRTEHPLTHAQVVITWSQMSLPPRLLCTIGKRFPTSLQKGLCGSLLSDFSALGTRVWP